MAYRIPPWLFVTIGGSAAAGAVMDKERRSTWIISGGLAMVGMVGWNLYVEAKTIEAVVQQGYIYGQPPPAGEEMEGMGGGWPYAQHAWNRRLH